MLPAHWPKPRTMRNPVTIAKRSRCCSPISSASWVSSDCVCEVRAAHNSNLPSPPSHKICVRSPSSWRVPRRSRPSRALRKQRVQFVASGVPTRQSRSPAAAWRKTTVPARPKNPGTPQTTCTTDFCNKIDQKRPKCIAAKSDLFDHLVGQRKQGRRNTKTECLRSIEIDHELKLGRQQDRQVRN
jgi:hypothetical protein